MKFLIHLRYPPGEYDLAGFAVGAIHRSSLLPHPLSVGDTVLGLTSSGLHSNGFSLVRKLVSVHGLDWHTPAPFAEADGARLCDVVLEPTRLYVKSLLPLVKTGLVKALAHITGGGLPENIPRVLSKDLAVSIDATSWSSGCPPVFKWISSLGNVPESDMFRTFNCGIGMVVVVAATKAAEVLTALSAAGETAFEIGKVVAREVDAEQVQINGSPFHN